MPANPKRVHHTKTIKDFYSEFKKKEKKVKPVSEIIEYHDYKNLIRDFFAEVQRRMIRDRLIFIMPHSLGIIYIKAYKRKENMKDWPIDFNLTKKYNKYVRHLNTHTNHYAFGVKWEKKYCKFWNKAFYTFDNTYSAFATERGAGKKALSKHIRELSKDPTRRSYIRI